VLIFLVGKKPIKPSKPQALAGKKPAKFALEGTRWAIVRRYYFHIHSEVAHVLF
jgi:hypothetical protein